MVTLVEQLQQDALDPSIRVSDLLRRVKLTAAKLGLDNVAAWVDAELKGYGGTKIPIPEYRQVFGQPKCRNPVRGDWMPLLFGNSQVDDMVSTKYIAQPLPGIEETVHAVDRRKGGQLYYPFPSGLVAELLRHMEFGFAEMGVFISPTSLVDIVDAVRNLVLDWALDLERVGVTGTASNFSIEEKRKASAVTVKIENFSGNFHAGDVSGAAARVNMGSTDNSTNVVGGAGAVFDGLESALRDSVSDRRERENLLDLAGDLRRAHKSSGFLDAYQRFIAAAANHMTIVAPFLPALAVFVAAH